VGTGDEAPDQLLANPANWRTHPKAQQQALAGVLDQVGWVSAILVNRRTGHLVDGHLRVELAITRGEASVPVSYVDLDADEEALVLASLDPLAAMAGVDDEKLRALLADVSVDDEALGAMLARLSAPEPKAGLTDPDEIPAPPDEAITKPGDLWILGEHRLLCGDSGNPADLDRLLDGATVDLLSTDPPYNVKVEPRSNNAIAAGMSDQWDASYQTALEASQAKRRNARGLHEFDQARQSGPRGHHQSMDLARHPEKAQATHRKMRAKDRPLVGDFITDEDFAARLDAWFRNGARVLRPGGAFYVWGGYANIANYPPALRAAGLYFSQAVIWVKEHAVLTRKDFMGNHEWCQPAGTRVLTPDGRVPIESLRDDDRVVSLDLRSPAITGLRDGLGIRTTSRPYDGDLYGVAVGGAETWTTDGHPWTVRFTAESAGMWCVYLMRRGRWWRVGRTRLQTTWGFGLKGRMLTEGGEEGWILSLHGSETDAGVAEQIASVRYGIPTTFWRSLARDGRSEAAIARIYDALDLDGLQAAAERALADHGRRLAFPFVRLGATRTKIGARVPVQVRACNLLPEAMTVPVPGRGHAFSWEPVRNVDRQAFAGPVYSMDVDRHHHYVADGIVTHNCFYGWKEGAGHRFFGPPNATDVWSVKKVNPRAMVHLTEKPTELTRLTIEYSSLPGEVVLDLFGGSGSALIAAEQTGRRARLMEIDPLYCDVIVRRFEEFTGIKPERIPAPTAEAA
jgi:DNA modification methylase